MSTLIAQSTLFLWWSCVPGETCLIMLEKGEGSRKKLLELSLDSFLKLFPIATQEVCCTEIWNLIIFYLIRPLMMLMVLAQSNSVTLEWAKLFIVSLMENGILHLVFMNNVELQHILHQKFLKDLEKVMGLRLTYGVLVWFYMPCLLELYLLRLMTWQKCKSLSWKQNIPLKKRTQILSSNHWQKLPKI